jgi:hypothetical protein
VLGDVLQVEWRHDAIRVLCCGNREHFNKRLYHADQTRTISALTAALDSTEPSLFTTGHGSQPAAGLLSRVYIQVVKFTGIQSTLPLLFDYW